MSLDGVTLLDLACGLQGVSLEPERAREIVIEIQVMSSVVATVSASELGFDDEPSDFVQTLQAHWPSEIFGP
jgi:hypothetical protein